MVGNIAFEITGGIGEPVSMPIPETTSAEAFERYVGGKRWWLVAMRRDESNRFGSGFLVTRTPHV
jgi:hypothetical protein